MKVIMVVSVLICIAVVLITALVTSKAYSVKHTIDPDPVNNSDDSSSNHKLS